MLLKTSSPHLDNKLILSATTYNTVKIHFYNHNYDQKDAKIQVTINGVPVIQYDHYFDIQKIAVGSQSFKQGTYSLDFIFVT